MTHRNRFHIALLVASGSLLGTSLAHAQAFDAVRLYGGTAGKDGGSIAAAVLAGTQYQGSDERRTLVLPVLDYQWANGWFAGVSNGVGYNFSSSAQLQYGLRLTAALDRKEDRSKALRGLGDVGARAEGGAFFNVLSSDGYFFSSSVRYGSGQDSKGLLLDLGAGHATSLAPQWHLGVGAAVTVANAAYLQSYFGVTAAQAASSGYAVYTPGAGLRDARANLSLTHVLNPRTRITGALTVSSLLGDAKSSPLTRQKTTAAGLLAVAYAF